MTMYPFPERTEQKSTAISFPAVQIDSEFRVLHANEVAAECGVIVGEYLLPPASDSNENCRLWHEACLRWAADSPLDPLSEDAQHVRVRLTGFHGFRLADIVYSCSLGGVYATAFLYRSPRYYWQHSRALTDTYGSYKTYVQDCLARLRKECSALLRGDKLASESTSQSIEEFLAAAAFLSRLPFFSPDCKRLFRLSFLLDTYLSDILPQMRLIDCRILRTESDGSDLSLPTDITAMFLLWTVLFRLLNDMADDRCIHVGWSRYGEDGEIRFSVRTRRLADLPTHIASISVLASYLPSLKMPLNTADYLAGCLDCYLDLHPDPAGGTLTFSLYIPEEKQIPDFKSPRESQTLLKEAILCLRGLLRVTGDAPTAPPEAAEE